MTEAHGDDARRSGWRRALVALESEFGAVHPRLHAYNLAARLLPAGSAGELRARLLRLVGFAIGEETFVNGELKITGDRELVSRLSLGRACSIGGECLFDLSEQLRIGDRVTIEPGVMILTSTHELDSAKHRAGPVIRSPVTIGDGVWLRARSIILPGTTIGDGAIVEAGSVVNKSVEPNTRVGGIPATKLETLSSGHE